MPSVIVVAGDDASSDIIFAQLARASLLTATFRNAAEVAQLAARMEAIFGFVPTEATDTEKLLSSVRALRGSGKRTVVILLAPASRGSETERDVHEVPTPLSADFVVQLVRLALDPVTQCTSHAQRRTRDRLLGNMPWA